MKEATVETLTKHARKYGPEFVMDAGIEAGLSQRHLVQLQKNLDAIEDSKLRKPPRRISAELRVKRLLGIEPEEGSQ